MTYFNTHTQKKTKKKPKFMTFYMLNGTHFESLRQLKNLKLFLNDVSEDE